MHSQQQLDTGNTAWMLMSSALVMLMTPGLGFFHAGLSGKKNTTNTILMSMMSMALVTMQWVLLGYSVSFGKGGNAFLGRFHETALRNIHTNISNNYGNGIPTLTFVAYQNMFAQITPALISGAALGRMNFRAYMLFILIWSIFIYNPIANWVWALNQNGDPKGWLIKMGHIDFAGGDVIHIASGFSALVTSLMLGKRNENHQPNNTLVSLGTALLWFGWFGFNAGSQLAADGIAALAFINTHISASFGVITWVFLDYFKTKNISALSAAFGAITGLVSITPGCGYIDPMFSFLFGFTGSLLAWICLEISKVMQCKYDIDAFIIHGIGGMVGTILTGVFSETKWNPNAPNGTAFGNKMQVIYQLIGVATIASYSTIGTFIILTILRLTLKIRMSDTEKQQGADESYHGNTHFIPNHNQNERVIQMQNLR